MGPLRLLRDDIWRAQKIKDLVNNNEPAQDQPSGLIERIERIKAMINIKSQDLGYNVEDLANYVDLFPVNVRQEGNTAVGLPYFCHILEGDAELALFV